MEGPHTHECIVDLANRFRDQMEQFRSDPHAGAPAMLAIATKIVMDQAHIAMHELVRFMDLLLEEAGTPPEDAHLISHEEADEIEQDFYLVLGHGDFGDDN